MAIKPELLFSLSITTGTLSLVGSCLLIATILRSRKKLSLPYRRIIFGTSVFDVFQSLGLTSSIFLSPKDVEPPVPYAIGNTSTCTIQGFLTTIGAIGVPIYLCSLSIYYFCTIPLNMKARTFKKIEPFLHAAPLVYSLSVGFYALANQYYNNAGSVCYVAPSPLTCEILPGVECNRGEGASKFRVRFLSFPSMIIFVIVCTTMAVITYSVKKQERRQRRHLFPLHGGGEVSDASSPVWRRLKRIGSVFLDVLFCVSLSRKNENENENDTGIDLDGTASRGENECPSEPKAESARTEMSPGPSQRISSSSRRRSSTRIRETTTQALLYVGCYVLSYGFVWAQSIYSLATNLPPPKAFTLLSSIFFPLQGFLNVFIYCRPHIVSLRRNFPDDYSWFQAFVKVLKSGGDDPLTVQERRMIRRISSSITVSHPSTRRPSMSAGMGDYEADSQMTVTMTSRTEIFERRSSITSRTTADLEEVPDNIQDSEKAEMGFSKITIPQGDAEHAQHNHDCNRIESSGENRQQSESSEPEVDDSDHYRRPSARDEPGNKTSVTPENNLSDVEIIPESLEDFIHEAEEALDDALHEVLELAREAENEANGEV